VKDTVENAKKPQKKPQKNQKTQKNVKMQQQKNEPATLYQQSCTLSANKSKKVSTE